MKRIPLTQGKFALIDDKDFDLVSQHKWYADGRRRYTYYARADILKDGDKKTTLRMHRLIMNPANGMEVDHIDGNGLNNCRLNLRICTRSQNARNQHPRGGSSQYKGVSWHKRDKKWQVRIKANGNRSHLGTFTDEIEAAKVYDKAAKKLFKEFAYLNFKGVELT